MRKDLARKGTLPLAIVQVSSSDDEDIKWGIRLWDDMDTSSRLPTELLGWLMLRRSNLLLSTG